MRVAIRPFEFEDIPLKIEWINNPENNRFLHYDLPLEYEKTCAWFEKNKGRRDRFDAVILADGRPVGLIGLLSIDPEEQKAEYYISMGETDCKGKGVAHRASELILEHAFRTLRLEQVYLYTETGNLSAQKLFERLTFRREGLAAEPLCYAGRYVDRFYYTMTKQEYLLRNGMTPIKWLAYIGRNEIYIKRDDLIPYSFGGNKARKGKLFFEEIDRGDYDCVVTYGSSHSNHCRIVANMAAERGMRCYIIGPAEKAEETANSRLMKLFDARIETVPVEQVRDTIEARLRVLRESGHKPYFIPGGGHGNIGTEAYVQCYDEIRVYEQMTGTRFDYIFFASGTGTTQAGLLCGQLMARDDRHIVGISIARKNPRGRDVVLDSVRDYLSAAGKPCAEEELQEKTVFIDDYTGEGYAEAGGKSGREIDDVIRRMMRDHGIPMDRTYTGKACRGMYDYLERQQITGKKVLFIHTGGTPLFFDELNEFGEFGESGE